MTPIASQRKDVGKWHGTMFVVMFHSGTLHSVLGKEEERQMLHQMQALAQKQVVKTSLTNHFLIVISRRFRTIFFSDLTAAPSLTFATP